MGTGLYGLALPEIGLDARGRFAVSAREIQDGNVALPCWLWKRNTLVPSFVAFQGPFLSQPDWNCSERELERLLLESAYT